MVNTELMYEIRRVVVIGSRVGFETTSTQPTSRYVTQVVGASTRYEYKHWLRMRPEMFMEVTPVIRVSLRLGSTLSLIPSSYVTELEQIREFIEILEHEWPEVYRVAEKLKRKEPLSEADELWLQELSEAVGWDRDDVVEDLRNIDVDPSERVKKYEELFKKYFEEARRLKGEGDTRQAAEKLWGAITALIKLYAAKKGIPVMHWSRGRMEKFITNNVEPEYRRDFRDLLDKGHTIHEHFYEGHLDDYTFEDRWRELINLIEKVKKIVSK